MTLKSIKAERSMRGGPDRSRTIFTIMSASQKVSSVDSTITRASVAVAGTARERDPFELLWAPSRRREGATDSRWWETLVGPSALLQQRMSFQRDLRSPSAAQLVPIARGAPLEAFAGLDAYLTRTFDPRDTVVGMETYAMDDQGAIWRAHVSQRRVADSYRSFVGKLAVLAEIAASGRRPIRVAPTVGEQLAQAPGATAIDEASDTEQRFWRAERVVLQDGTLGYRKEEEAPTLCWVDGATGAADVIAALATIGGARADMDLGVPMVQEPPAAAPSASTALACGGARVPLGFSATEGALVVEAAVDGRRIRRIRTYAGRVLEWGELGGPSRGYMLAADALAPFVSQDCLAWIRLRGVYRDPQDTLPRAALARALNEAGLPAHDAVLEFEEHAGGLWIPGPGDGEVHSLGAAIQLAAHVKPWADRVPMGAQPNDGRYWMDARGAICWQTTASSFPQSSRPGGWSCSS